MPIIDIKEWSPDAADFGNPGAISVKNAVPGITSYQPLNSLVTATDALDARPRGAIEAIDENENVFQYAGNASKIYSLSGMAWSDVSLGGGYATAAGERWEFVRWKEQIIATNYTDDPQEITFGGANFADLTTALKFRHVGVVRDFVVAGNTFDGSDGIVRDRVRWCAINDPSDWTPSATTLADFRDLNVGGGVQAVVGGEYGVIVMERSTFRMTFIGTPVIFQIDETVPGIGSLAPGGVVQFGGAVYFPSEQGMIRIVGGAREEFIGAGRIDNFFLRDFDLDYTDRMSAVADPISKKVFWLYPGAGNTAGTPNKVIVYDTVLNKWGYAELEAELIWRSGGTSTTLEALDDLNLGSELISNGDFATDTIWTKGTGWTISGGTGTHAAGTASDLSQTIAVAADTFYRLEFDVSGRTAGSVTPDVGGTNGTAISADDTDIKETIRAASDGDVKFEATSDFDGSIDNVSVKDVDDLDTMTITLDSSTFKGSSPQLAGFDTAFTNGNFVGTPYTAVFETRETTLAQGRRTRLNAFEPIIDGGTVTARVGSRNRQSDNVEYTTTLNLRASGRFTKRVNANYHRFELTVSGDWSDAVGVFVDRNMARPGDGRG